MPDNDGKVVMDYCVYVVESAMKGQTSLYQDEVAGHNQYVEDGAEKGPLPEVLITGVAPYWTDAESNLLLCAMTTLFLKLENYDDASPFYCVKNDRYCNGCGDCGDMSKRSSLAKHHLCLYHFLLTVTGLGLMYGDPNETGDYDLKYIRRINPPMLEDRIDFAMKAEGFEYIRLDKQKGEQEIFRQITGFPWPH